jgi:type IV pilus assembly protein PilQ
MRTHLLFLVSLSAAAASVAQQEPAVAVPSNVVEPAASESASAPVEPTPVAIAPLAVVSPGVVGVPSLVEVESSSSVTKSKDTLSVDFPDEEIRTILRNVADLFELNLVIPDTLQGRTSLKLREVTWRQIFQVILSPIGYTFVEDGNIIKIVSLSALAEEPLATEIFIINYAKAADIKGAIDSIVDTAVGGKVIVDVRSNGLVITERSSRMGRIRPIIEKLDKATEQVVIESKFVEVTNRDVKNIGVNWASLSGYGVSAGPFSQTYNKSNTSGGTSTFSTTNTDPRISQAYANAGSALGLSGPLSPAPSNQAAIDNALATNLAGINNPQFTPVVVPAPVFSGGGSSSAVSTTGNTTGRSTTAVFNADQFSVVLSALKTNNDVKLVSNPTVVTLNNVQATINIGEQFPVPSYTYNSERGAFEVSGFEYKDIGVNLKVTPQINSQGFIKLTVEPEVSVRNGTTSFGGAGGAEIPIVATRKTSTQVSMKDGYTLGIGGLIENTATQGGSKVPVLGSIPFIGRFFSSKSSDTSSRNLLIFITAKTVSSEGAAAGEIFDPRAIRATGLKKDELPGYRDGSDPFPEPPAPEFKKKKSFLGSKER